MDAPLTAFLIRPGADVFVDLFCECVAFILPLIYSDEEDLSVSSKSVHGHLKSSITCAQERQYFEHFFGKVERDH